MTTAVCILGMHRSGTSSVARVLNLLGVYLGESDEMYPADPIDNPTGYWEPRSVVSIQQEILLSFGFDSLDLRPLPRNWRDRREVVEGRAKIRDFVETTFTGRQLWGWKDPRTCVLLPLWQGILAELGMDVCYIIVLRNPLHVAASLERRYGTQDGRKFQLIWHYYMLSALSYTRNSRRVIISYHDVLADWRTVIRRVREQTGLMLDPSEDSAATRLIDEFVQPALEHGKTRETEIPPVSFVQEAYEIMAGMRYGGPIASEDSRLQDLLDLYATYADEILSARAPEVQKALSDRDQAIDRANAELRSLRAELQTITSSRSWKVTAPLRRLSSRVGR